jgi:hypothetical protein
VLVRKAEVAGGFVDRFRGAYLVELSAERESAQRVVLVQGDELAQGREVHCHG